MLAALGMGLAPTSVPVILLCTLLWGLSFGGSATLLQTALGDAAGADADVAQSMLVVVWNMAMAAGGLFGGLLLNRLDIRQFPWIIVLLLLLCFWIAWRARQAGFKAGARGNMLAS